MKKAASNREVPPIMKLNKLFNSNEKNFVAIAIIIAL